MCGWRTAVTSGFWFLLKNVADCSLKLRRAEQLIVGHDVQIQSRQPCGNQPSSHTHIHINTKSKHTHSKQTLLFALSQWKNTSRVVFVHGWAAACFLCVCLFFRHAGRFSARWRCPMRPRSLHSWDSVTLYTVSALCSHRRVAIWAQRRSSGPQGLTALKNWSLIIFLSFKVLLQAKQCFPSRFSRAALCGITYEHSLLWGCFYSHLWGYKGVNFVRAHWKSDF